MIRFFINFLVYALMSIGAYAVLDEYADGLHFILKIIIVATVIVILTVLYDRYNDIGFSKNDQ